MRVITKALAFLKVREFVALATTDKAGKPNSAPKLLLKIDGGVIYFIDYSIGRTAENLRVNPKVSLSLIDINSLFGYVLNGSVEIIKKGRIYNECLKELRKKEIKLFVERIVKGLRYGRPHRGFESDIPEHFLVYKIKIKESSEITPRGVIKRESN